MLKTVLRSVPLLAMLLLAACAPAARDPALGVPTLAAYPPVGRILEVDGHAVHVLVTGHGPDVILIHGASVNMRDFTFDLVGDLAKEFRVIAIDRPGLGYSDPLHDAGESPAEQAAFLDSVAARLGVRHAVVVGHSYGASVAMAWAIYYPRRVAGIVTLSGVTMPWPGNLGPWPPMASSAFGGATIVPLVSALAPRGAAQRAADFFFSPQKAPPGYVDYVGIDLALRPASLQRNARQVDILKPYIVAMAAHYPQMRLPVEVVNGTADRIVPPDTQAAPFAEILPNAHLTLLPGVGHMVHHVRPDAVIAAIRRAALRGGLHPAG